MRRRGPVLKQAPSGEIYASESATQISCVRWFRIVFAHLGLYLFSIPNGGKLPKIQAAIMVGEGLTEGVGDLLLALPRCGLHGLFLEMKTPVGYWETKQREFAKRQIAEGYGYVLCRNQNQFERAVTDYLAGNYTQLPFSLINEYSKK